MAEIYVARKGNYLRAATHKDLEVIKRFPEGQPIACKVRRPRSLKNHRLFFGILRQVVDNSERFRDEEHLALELKLKTGYVDTYIAEDGETYFIPKSIDFDHCDEDQFLAWISKALDVIYEQYLPETTPLELHDMLAKMEGIVGR